MKVNFNLINIYRPVFKGIKHTFVSTPLKADSFERVQKAESVWDKNRIKQIYDEVWRDFIQEFPVINEIGAPRPDIIVDDNEDSLSVASYSFFNKNIIIASEYKQDYYFIIENSDSEDKYCSIGSQNSVNADFCENGQFLDDVVILKLNDYEKELFYKSAVAHELRHFLQDYLLVSCIDTFEEAKSINQMLVDEFKETTKRLISSCNKLIKSGEIHYIQDIFEYKKILREYIKNQNFKPKKYLPANYKLKFYSPECDNRYISVKEHLLKSKSIRMIHRYEYKERFYNSDPSEIDAYNYEAEYILKKMPEYGNKIRKELFDLMSSTQFTDNEINIEEMEELGYPKI